MKKILFVVLAIFILLGVVAVIRNAHREVYVPPDTVPEIIEIPTGCDGKDCKG